MFIHSKVVRESRQIECTFYGAINKYEEVRELIEGLESLSAHDALILKINSPGGSVAVGMMVVKAIQACPALIVARIVHPSASMASIIALACDTLIMDENTYLMFHTYSSGHGGKSDDVVQDVIETNKHIRSLDKTILQPFLTKKEISRMHDGKDIYIHAEDENLAARIKKHFPFKGEINL